MAEEEANAAALNQRLELAEMRNDLSKAVMDSLAGFCHALGQPATVLMSSIELLKMDCDAQTRAEVLDMSYDAVIEIRSLLAQMKEKREYVREAYLASTDTGGDMIALKEWREKTPPKFAWEK